MSVVRRSSDALLDSYGPALFAVACVLIHDPMRAEKLVGQTILASDDGFLRRPKVDSCVVARRLAAQVYRRYFCADPHASGSITVLATDDSPYGALHWDLRALTDDHRAALALCKFGGHTYRQAAVVLDLPASHVAELLCEALRQLNPEGREPSIEMHEEARDELS
ncbi:MAG: hypothetical protein H7288_13890 [Kineosporiaceae bacterium]|nr:hypothetical protein [Aeromicrobium sp.]